MLSAAVFVLVLILLSVLGILLIVVLLLLGILSIILLVVIHDFFLRNLYLRPGRYHRMPSFSSFILGLENQADKQTCHHCSGDTPGGGFQTSGEDTQETV